MKLIFAAAITAVCFFAVCALLSCGEPPPPITLNGDTPEFDIKDPAPPEEIPAVNDESPPEIFPESPAPPPTDAGIPSCPKKGKGKCGCGHKTNSEKPC